MLTIRRFFASLAVLVTFGALPLPDSLSRVCYAQSSLKQSFHVRENKPDEDHSKRIDVEGAKKIIITNNGPGILRAYAIYEKGGNVSETYFLLPGESSPPIVTADGSDFASVYVECIPDHDDTTDTFVDGTVEDW